MPLAIQTFDNKTGGNAFYKAIAHPLAAEAAARLIADLVGAGPVALYDPDGYGEGLAALHDLTALDIRGVFGQRLDRLGEMVLGHVARPVSELGASGAARVLVAAFDAERAIGQIRHLLPAGAVAVSLDAIRLPDAMLTNHRRYLDPLNFATNFAFFREADGLHTRLTTANYWSGYGGVAIAVWCRLFAGDGQALATWQEPVASDGASLVIDSGDVRRRFGLGPFTGQLFLHVIGAVGHDVVKYALDVTSDDGLTLSSSHDANAWPSDRYAGLPAPSEEETVILWLQNSHPSPIPPGAIGLNVMGKSRVAWLDRKVAPFASLALDTRRLHGESAWPSQFEVRAGKHMVRPRYEIVGGNGRRRIAHVNVERADLAPDPGLAQLSSRMGKGFILAGPLLPPARFRSELLPTPMATCQAELPIAALVYDATGREVARHNFGRLARAGCVAFDLAPLVAEGRLQTEWGHIELVYDFAQGGDGDGWLHAIFRYTERASGHAAETSFGAHIFNTVLVYGNEPQSYSGPPPGLSTRLFLRLGVSPLDTFCHLIYPASTPWHPVSATDLALYDGRGRKLAERRVEIACGGSLLWRQSLMFDAGERRAAGDRGYVVVRDTTCRLFGYHGLSDGAGAFSLDHMFGF
ncbi:MAG: hypothetical protein EXQ87_04645 [Alphaproteobacteria bacterium]|nr:hypothetical protein [Alphaproteobacteria bacterium]